MWDSCQLSKIDINTEEKHKQTACLELAEVGHDIDIQLLGIELARHLLQ